jgi:hypothetical protein
LDNNSYNCNNKNWWHLMGDILEEKVDITDDIGPHILNDK